MNFTERKYTYILHTRWIDHISMNFTDPRRLIETVYIGNMYKTDQKQLDCAHTDKHQLSCFL